MLHVWNTPKDTRNWRHLRRRWMPTEQFMPATACKEFKRRWMTSGFNYIRYFQLQPLLPRIWQLLHEKGSPGPSLSAGSRRWKPMEKLLVNIYIILYSPFHFTVLIICCFHFLSLGVFFFFLLGCCLSWHYFIFAYFSQPAWSGIQGSVRNTARSKTREM